MGYFPWLISTGMLQLNPGAWGGASHQPALTGSCLLVTYGSPVFLVVDESRPCVLWLLMIELMVVPLTFF